MKLILEILVAIILHPIAWILMLLNLLGRTDLSDGKKVIWALVGVLWGIGPILYVLVGDGTLW
jgi:Phospholipase_D-nuclease N-terminal